jgi:hypothetical protein
LLYEAPDGILGIASAEWCAPGNASFDSPILEAPATGLTQRLHLRIADCQHQRQLTSDQYSVRLGFRATGVHCIKGGSGMVDRA